MRVAPILSIAACNSISGANDLSIAGPDAGGGFEWQLPGTAESDASKPAKPQADAVSATANVLVVPPDGLDFGVANCGSSPAPRRVEVHNLGTSEITFNAAMATLDSFSVSPPTGSIPSGGVAELSVASAAVPQDGPPSKRATQLVVTTTAREDVPHVFDVTLLVSGAIFKVSLTGTYDFGTTKSPKTKKFTIRNDGDISGTISLAVKESVSNAFDVTPTLPAVLAPGEEAERTITAHPPKSGTPTKTGTITFSTTSTFCGSIPSPIQLKAFNND